MGSEKGKPRPNPSGAPLAQVVSHEAPKTSGFGAELASTVPGALSSEASKLRRARGTRGGTRGTRGTRGCGGSGSGGV